MACSRDEDLIGLTQNNFTREKFIPEFDVFSDILASEECRDVGTEQVKVNTAKQPAGGDKERTLKYTTINRNVSLITDKELERRKDARIPENTEMTFAWAAGVWRDRAAEWNSKATTTVSTERTVSADILTNTNDELNK